MSSGSKGPLEVALGIATSIGGFLEAGSIATAAQAGAEFSYQLIWAIALGTICVLFLVEMSGRLAAVSGHTIAAAVRERFGFPFFAGTAAVVLLVAFLVLIAEIGGVCYGLQLATGVAFRWFAIPVTILLWIYIWKGSFNFVEQVVSLLGLITIAFAISALKLHPPIGGIARGLLPSLPSHDGPRYWFIACSILGASVSPYLFYFYSSGAIEDEWKERDLGINRIVATVGMLFGGLLSVAVLLCSAGALAPLGVTIETFADMPPLLSPLGRAGLGIFAAALAIACFGAAVEVALSAAYFLAQGLGWQWSKNRKPYEVARFSLVYTVLIPVAAVPTLLGADPLKMTVMSMALTAASLPVAIVPFLVLMNDKKYVGEHCNHRVSNTVVLAIVAMACVLAIVTIPLQIFGGD
jgi:Mn2+/Fe2+ NRAMP family transporter